ncbi:MAG: hypothetical protein Q8J90_05330, partial [Gallionella sp.]|nr:hypothetical protein [Gallionella sp.]
MCSPELIAKYISGCKTGKIPEKFQSGISDCPLWQNLILHLSFNLLPVQCQTAMIAYIIRRILYA